MARLPTLRDFNGDRRRIVLLHGSRLVGLLVAGYLGDQMDSEQILTIFNAIMQILIALGIIKLSADQKNK